ncbi:hypothetical protein N9N67_11160 [Bacteriovoracaceae bacterium]|nr:hypothetical protein [Bacteriovoracaceae bacterium]
MRYLVLLGFSLILSLAFGQKDDSIEPEVPESVMVEEAVILGLNILDQFGIEPYCKSEHSLIIDDSFDVESWSPGGFGRTVKYLISDEILFEKLDPNTSFTHELSVSVVFPHEGSWKLSNVQEELIELQRVYAKCGIKIRPEVFQTTFPSGEATILYEKGDVAETSSPELRSKDHLGAVTPISPTSAGVYLFDRFSDNAAQPGTSSPQWSNLEGCSHVNYSWVAFCGSEEKSNKYDFMKYSVLAHEMTHNLANVGHGPNFQKGVLEQRERFIQDCNDPTKYNCLPKVENDERSIMNGNPGSRSPDLSNYLCQRILSHPNVKGIESKTD